MRALQARNHSVLCWEQSDNWSLEHLLAESPEAVAQFQSNFPDLKYQRYTLGSRLEAELRRAVAETDVVVVHEWNEPRVIRLIGRIAQDRGVKSVFHDTHYRVVLDPFYRERLGLDNFDCIAAFSPSLAERYSALGYRNVHVLHEAADTTVFAPREVGPRDDVIFIGNYGDGDRDDELEAFLFRPRRSLPHLRYAVYGVRYPGHVLARLRGCLNIDYRGRIPNVDVPAAYSAAKVALHIPRRQYVELLPGTPTIRVFEALATGTCLISLPWCDTDGLFQAGKDFVVARTPDEMRDTVRELCSDPIARRAVAQQGLQTVLARHTCNHRADQLLEIVRCA
ncbi:MAG TPA: glycosyltransferase [Chloroflexota bacterium]|nr:glycosyltransferase [Chloroflexota bacterium]